MKQITSEILSQALSLLNQRLQFSKSPPIELVVCGGSALIATQLVSRTTKDLDILALKNADSALLEPEPLPDYLMEAASVVANTFQLPGDWLNTGPADLFRMGLPEGFISRLITKEIGPCLKVHYISRTDQIYFKLYASVDRGGYHIQDLMALNPSEEELIQAGKWSKTHDVSEGYHLMLKSLLSHLGFVHAAEAV